MKAGTGLLIVGLGYLVLSSVGKMVSNVGAAAGERVVEKTKETVIERYTTTKENIIEAAQNVIEGVVEDVKPIVKPPWEVIKWTHPLLRLPQVGRYIKAKWDVTMGWVKETGEKLEEPVKKVKAGTKTVAGAYAYTHPLLRIPGAAKYVKHKYMQFTGGYKPSGVALSMPYTDMPIDPVSGIAVKDLFNYMQGNVSTSRGTYQDPTPQREAQRQGDVTVMGGVDPDVVKEMDIRTEVPVTVARSSKGRVTAVIGETAASRQRSKMRAAQRAVKAGAKDRATRRAAQGIYRKF